MPDTQTKVDNKFGVNLETAGALANRTSSEISVQESIKTVMDSINTFPGTVTNIFTENKSLFVLLLIVASGLVTLRFVTAILGAVEGIPLLAPMMELVGLGYSVWFIYRYLLWADTRQELRTDVEDMKSRFTGKNS